MLYERWQDVARTHADEIALTDLKADRQWTFRQLSAAAAQIPAQPDRPVVCLEGTGVEFILALLAAWREGTVVCPLEPGQSPPALPPPPPGIAHLKMTSATTNRTRVVAFTARQLAADVNNIVLTMGLRRDWPNLGLLSLAHSYGFSNLILPLLLHGIPLILLDSPLPESLRRATAPWPDLTLPAVPALWRAWHDANAIPATIRLAISAGAPLPLSLEEEVFSASGVKIHNFYGATECGGIAFDRSPKPRSDGASVGSPMENVDLSINAAGCLVVRSEAVAESYWPEAESSLRGGCYESGDLAEVVDGRVMLRGRACDQINVAGRKASPETIERLLLTHPQVKDCLIFGAPSPEQSRSELIVACVVLQSEVVPDSLKQFLLARLPAWQVPREWRFVDSLAPNRRGKLSRAEWRARLGFASLTSEQRSEPGQRSGP